jgi:hypothetical protein
MVCLEQQRITRIKNSSKYIFIFLGGARLGSASGCFKKATQTANPQC